MRSAVARDRAVLLVFAVVPFGGVLDPGAVPRLAAGWRAYLPMQIAQIDAGLLVCFAFSGITIIGAMLAGWSSANSSRCSAPCAPGSQLISYELVMGLTVLGLILVYGSSNLVTIVSTSRAPCSASCPPGESSTSPSRPSCSSPRASPRTSASRSTCPKPSRS
jgi:NADH:ubiquinone oxidoreductase subunit H